MTSLVRHSDDLIKLQIANYFIRFHNYLFYLTYNEEVKLFSESIETKIIMHVLFINAHDWLIFPLRKCYETNQNRAWLILSI